MANRFLWNTQVTWRGALLLFVFVAIGFALSMELSLPNKTNASFAEWVVVVGGVLSSLLVGLRIRGADGWERIQVVKKVGIGMLLMVAAGVATVISHDYLWWAEDHARWFIVPTGIYFSGMAVIANAMNPQHQQWAGSTRRSRAAIANKGRAPKAVDKPQARKWAGNQQSAARPIPVPDELPLEELPPEELTIEETVEANPLPSPRASLPLSKTLPRPPMPTFPPAPLNKRPNRHV